MSFKGSTEHKLAKDYYCFLTISKSPSCNLYCITRSLQFWRGYLWAQNQGHGQTTPLFRTPGPPHTT